jgi:hypothetical protein
VEGPPLEPGVAGFTFWDQKILERQRHCLEVGRKGLRICYRFIRRAIFVQLLALLAKYCVGKHRGDADVQLIPYYELRSFTAVPA